MPTCPRCGDRVRARSPNRIKKNKVIRHKRCDTDARKAYKARIKANMKQGKEIPVTVTRAPWYKEVYRKLLAVSIRKTESI